MRVQGVGLAEATLVELREELTWDLMGREARAGPGALSSPAGGLRAQSAPWDGETQMWRHRGWGLEARGQLLGHIPQGSQGGGLWVPQVVGYRNLHEAGGGP